MDECPPCLRCVPSITVVPFTSTYGHYLLSATEEELAKMKKQVVEDQDFSYAKKLPDLGRTIDRLQKQKAAYLSGETATGNEDAAEDAETVSDSARGEMDERIRSLTADIARIVAAVAADQYDEAPRHNPQRANCACAHAHLHSQALGNTTLTLARPALARSQHTQRTHQATSVGIRGRRAKGETGQVSISAQTSMNT
jgi:hypothetical protein